MSTVRWALIGQALLPLFALSLFASPIQAQQVPQTWVSAQGADGNPCTLSQPCATLAVAFSHTATPGGIGCLTSGQFGPLTINHSVEIDCESVHATIQAPSGNGILVDGSPTDDVIISGLDVQGGGTGTNGIQINTVGHILVRNTKIEGFLGGSGIVISPPNGGAMVSIETSTIADNNVGLRAVGAGSAVTPMLLSHSTVSANVTSGVKLQGTSGPIGLTIDASVISGNTNGTNAIGPSALIRLRNSIISANSTAILTQNGATTTSTGTNQITDNLNPGNAPTIIGQQ